MIHNVATCFAIGVLWMFCGLGWTAMLALIDARLTTSIDSCFAPSGLCGVWLMSGGYIISTTMIIVWLIFRARRETGKNKGKLYDEYSTSSS